MARRLVHDASGRTEVAAENAKEAASPASAVRLVTRIVGRAVSGRECGICPRWPQACGLTLCLAAAMQLRCRHTAWLPSRCLDAVTLPHYRHSALLPPRDVDQSPDPTWRRHRHRHG